MEKRIKSKNIYCPFCKKNHLVEEITKKDRMFIKNEIVNYDGKFYFCADKQESFATKALNERNVLKAKDIYRENHNLLTSIELKRIRDKYDLTQQDLADILGWGGATISRYETKDIQSEKYDKILRKINVNPYILYGYFQVNEELIEEKRRKEIKEKLLDYLQTEGIKDIQDKIKLIVGFYQEKQLDVAIEEMSELTKEICKFKRNQGNNENLKEEIADVVLMIKQLMFYFNFNKKEIDNIIDFKIKRTLERMNIEN